MSRSIGRSSFPPPRGGFPHSQRDHGPSSQPGPNRSSSSRRTMTSGYTSTARSGSWLDVAPRPVFTVDERRRRPAPVACEACRPALQLSQDRAATRPRDDRLRPGRRWPAGCNQRGSSSPSRTRSRHHDVEAHPLALRPHLPRADRHRAAASLCAKTNAPRTIIKRNCFFIGDVYL